MTCEEVVARWKGLPDRERDAWIHEKVFGYGDPIELTQARSAKTAKTWFTAFKRSPIRADMSASYDMYHTRDNVKVFCGKPFYVYLPLYYTIRIDAALEIITRMRKLGWWWYAGEDEQGVFARFIQRGTGHNGADTMAVGEGYTLMQNIGIAALIALEAAG
jgi:hypothetical protein